MSNEPLKMLFEADAPPDALLGKTVAVLGFGSQGQAHALNLRDSGINVIVGNRPQTERGRRAIELGFETLSLADATRRADLLIFGLPDESTPDIYRDHVRAHLRPHQALGFLHGFNVHYETIEIPPDVDVIMVAPKAAGPGVRSEFEKRIGPTCLLSVHQDATGRARAIALAWAGAIGGGKGGIIECSFKDETETDLFGEQVVLCGGLSGLIKAGFETLVEAGYPAELAYFECLHEVKLIVDLIYVGGLDHMRSTISNTAEFGDLTRGPRVINERTRAEMRAILSEVQSGQFAREWRAEYDAGLKKFRKWEADEREHPIEAIGRKLRNARRQT